ncbi:MAG: hypothetical protein Q9228_007566 [Teloschistes exilis]
MINVLSALYNTKGAYFERINKPRQRLCWNNALKSMINKYLSTQRARLQFLQGRVLELMGDASAPTVLKQAAMKRDELLGKKASTTAGTLTFGAFDDVVPFDAR